jgi:hypothetical protein
VVSFLKNGIYKPWILAYISARKDYKAEEIDEWLKVSLPILEGPFAGRPWIKYVFKRDNASQWSSDKCLKQEVNNHYFTFKG